MDYFVIGAGIGVYLCAAVLLITPTWRYWFVPRLKVQLQLDFQAVYSKLNEHEKANLQYYEVHELVAKVYPLKYRYIGNGCIPNLKTYVPILLVWVALWPFTAPFLAVQHTLQQLNAISDTEMRK